MVNEIFSKDAQEYIGKLAEALKGVSEFEVPEWVSYVKSGVGRERAPESDDFWYVRAASILRQLYVRGVVGVNRLRTRYGCKKSRGVRPSKFRKGGGKIIRVILQQAEKAGFVEKVEKLQHGRRLTQKGRDFLDAIKVEENKELDVEVVADKPIEFEQEVEEEKEEKKEEEKVESDVEEIKSEEVKE